MRKIDNRLEHVNCVSMFNISKSLTSKTASRLSIDEIISTSRYGHQNLINKNKSIHFLDSKQGPQDTFKTQTNIFFRNENYFIEVQSQTKNIIHMKAVKGVLKSRNQIEKYIDIPVKFNQACNFVPFLCVCSASNQIYIYSVITRLCVYILYIF